MVQMPSTKLFGAVSGSLSGMKRVSKGIVLLVLASWFIPHAVVGAVIDQLIDKSNYLASTFCRQGFVEYSTRNLMVSAPSSLVAVGVISAGGSQRMKSDIYAPLGMSKIRTSDFLRGVALLHSVLNDSTSDVTMKTAVSVWASKQKSVSDGYAKLVNDYFDVETFQGAIGGRDSPIKFQKWSQTHLDRSFKDVAWLTSSTNSVVVVDGLLFRGEWSNGFSPSKSDDRFFMLPDGSVKRTPFMINRAKYQYAETPTVQAVVLPYGDGRFEMVLVMPRRWDSSVIDWVEQPPVPFYDANVNVVMPKFSIFSGCSSRLRKIRSDIRATVMDRAEFPIIGDSFAVSDWIQYIGFDVNERGKPSSLGGGDNDKLPSCAILLNRPFVVAVRDTISGLIVLQGLIVNPEYKEVKNNVVTIKR